MAGLVALAFQQGSNRLPLTFVRAISLPNVEGRIDHFAYDAASQQLFVAALENNSVEVIDVKSATHVASLKGFHEPQGIAWATNARIVAVANGEGGGLQFIDPALKSIATIALGNDADNVRYDPVGGRLYVGYGSGALAAINPETRTVSGRATLAGHPESFQLELSGSRIFVNVPSAHEIAVLDRAAMKVITTWGVTQAASNFPMAFDDANHRLFVGCRRPAKALAYDTGTGAVVTSFDIVSDTDDLFYDASRRRLYVTGGEGFLDVFDEPSPNHFVRVQHEATAAGARTSLFVPDLGRLYVAVPHRGTQPAETRVFEAR